MRTPVWFAALDGKLFVFTAGNSGKVKRLRRTSRARISPCDARGNVNGPGRDVTARIVTDPSVIARASAAMQTKYGWQARLLDLFSRLTGRIQHRAWIEIEI